MKEIVMYFKKDFKLVLFFNKGGIMIKLKPTSLVVAKDYNIENIFPDISDILKKNIESSVLIKKEIIDYVKKDKAGVQFNCVRLCSQNHQMN